MSIGHLKAQCGAFETSVYPGHGDGDYGPTNSTYFNKVPSFETFFIPFDHFLSAGCSVGGGSKQWNQFLKNRHFIEIRDALLITHSAH